MIGTDVECRETLSVRLAGDAACGHQVAAGVGEAGSRSRFAFREEPDSSRTGPVSATSDPSLRSCDSPSRSHTSQPASTASKSFAQVRVAAKRALQ